MDVAFSLDGNKLYFCSTRPNQLGSIPEPKHDIWFCNRLKNSNWLEPKNLGTSINSLEGETCPCFTKNGRMYFAFFRKGGYVSKGYKIYYTIELNTGWYEPRLVSFSSDKSDVDVCITYDGKRMYFGTNHPVKGVK